MYVLYFIQLNHIKNMLFINFNINKLQLMYSILIN